MIEDFINAINNFKLNKMRAFLSLLGIVIGVMSVIIITTLSQSLTASIADEFKRYSLDVVNIQTRWNRDENKLYLEFTEEYRETLLKRIPQIKNIFYTNEFNARVLRNDISAGSKTILFVEPEKMIDTGLKIDYGNFFTVTDYAYGLQKAILGKNIAEELFPEGRAVGKTMTLQINSKSNSVPFYNFEFEVVGVIKESVGFVGNPSNTVYIPRQFFKRNLMYAGRENYELWSAEAKLYDPSEIEYVQSQIKAISAEFANGNPQSVWIFSPKEMLDSLNNVLTIVRIIMTAVSAISLLVGGIGIMNIMLVTITERKKEIGIRKALGATNAAITSQFLVESAALTVTGGAIGVILGLAIGAGLPRIILPLFVKDSSVTVITAFDINGVLLSFIVSICIGIFFGLSPALKAAKLDPVKALAD